MKPLLQLLPMLLLVYAPGLTVGEGGDEKTRKIARLEAELDALRRTAAKSVVTCKVTSNGAGGRLSLSSVGDGYLLRNTTVPTAGGNSTAELTVLNLRMGIDTEIEMQGMLIRIVPVEASHTETTEPTDGNDEQPLTLPVVVGGNILAMLGCCLFVGVVAVLEKRYQCIGSEKIHHFVEQQREITSELHSVLTMMGDGQEAGHSTSHPSSAIGNSMVGSAVSTKVAGMLGGGGTKGHFLRGGASAAVGEVSVEDALVLVDNTAGTDTRKAAKKRFKAERKNRKNVKVKEGSMQMNPMMEEGSGDKPLVNSDSLEDGLLVAPTATRGSTTPPVD